MIITIHYGTASVQHRIRPEDVNRYLAFLLKGHIRMLTVTR